MNSALERDVDLWAGEEVDAWTFCDIRRELLLEHCKWDAQVGDVTTLARFPLVLSRDEWGRMARDAEMLAEELTGAEGQMARCARMQKRLGVPWRLRRCFERAREVSGPDCPVRVMRFDFHPTAEGWRVSEVNSDVPGGFVESSVFAGKMAEALGMESVGDPAEAWTDAVMAKTDGPVALLAAAGFLEDQQVVAHLAQRLVARGRTAFVGKPEQIEWLEGLAHWNGARLGAIVRFYQGEWLVKLRRSCGWEQMIAGGKTPVTNPAVAMLSESKRFPLLWDELGGSFETWRRLLPDTRDPREAPWRTDEGWLIKSAYCNTGDTVAWAGMGDAKRWREAARACWWSPGAWVAQRRFEVRGVDSPMGVVYPCIGVYVVDGRAAGAYGRISTSRLIDYQAIDVAVLLEKEACR